MKIQEDIFLHRKRNVLNTNKMSAFIFNKVVQIFSIIEKSQACSANCQKSTITNVCSSLQTSNSGIGSSIPIYSLNPNGFCASCFAPVVSLAVLPRP